MTSEQINEIQFAYQKVGYINFKNQQLFFCEGIENKELTCQQALQEIAIVWNGLGDLLNEIANLEQDHARMTQALHLINQQILDTLQGTARSQVAADWWEMQPDRLNRSKGIRLNTTQHDNMLG